MDNKELEPDKGYPWRSSLTKKAVCGMCAFCKADEQGNCLKKHRIIYPLLNGEHHCKDYLFRPDNPKVYPGPFGHADFPECENCAHCYNGICDGKRWLPLKREPICEFFYDKKLVCKNAIPEVQYGNHIRNNFCKLPPHLRDGDSKRGWKWRCPNAHTQYAKNLKCYKPKEEDVEQELD